MEALSYSLCFCKRDTPSSHCDGILIVPINKISPLPISSLVFNFSRPLHISLAGDIWDVTMKAASHTVLVSSFFFFFCEPKTPFKILYHAAQMTRRRLILFTRPNECGENNKQEQWQEQLSGAVPSRG